MVWSLPLRKAASRALEGLDLTSRISLCSRAAQQFVQQMSLEHTVSTASPQSAGFLAELAAAQLCRWPRLRVWSCEAYNEAGAGEVAVPSDIAVSRVTNAQVSLVSVQLCNLCVG